MARAGSREEILELSDNWLRRFVGEEGGAEEWS